MIACGAFMIWSALPCAVFMAAYLQTGWALLFGFVPFAVGIGAIQKALNASQGSDRHQLNIILLSFVFLALWSNMSFTGNLIPEPWLTTVQIATIVTSISLGIWLLTNEFAAFSLKWQGQALRSSADQPNNSVEDRLDELERLKRRDMVTPEEYAAKRQEILKDL